MQFITPSTQNKFKRYLASYYDDTNIKYNDSFTPIIEDANECIITTAKRVSKDDFAINNINNNMNNMYGYTNNIGMY